MEAIVQYLLSAHQEVVRVSSMGAYEETICRMKYSKLDYSVSGHAKEDLITNGSKQVGDIIQDLDSDTTTLNSTHNKP